MSIVICKLPRAGLGNQLFPLMNAFVFARLNDLPVIVTGYHRLKIGPYLRGEKRKRRYNGYFTFQKNVVGEYLDIWKISRLKKKTASVYESKIQKLKQEDLQNKLFIFEKMTTYHDYFIDLKDHREKVIEILYSILSPWVIEKITDKRDPVIGIHVRMGDFRKLNKGEVYSGGHVRVPESYFINTITAIRKINGSDLPVSVFTDGYENEFDSLFDLNNVKVAESNPDIVDMLLLSKAKIIIPTHGSTFSIWAAFLSNATLVFFFNHVTLIRPENMSKSIYEGVLNPEDELLKSNIKSINIDR